MNGDIVARTTIDDSTTDSFAAALDRFATGLSGPDHAILVAVLNAAMGPWERMAARPAQELLDPADAQLVERLVERARRGED
ncbi:hypothetical protein ACFC1R_21490 [Kitasatospora sp. NPDC056138]|uniref:hypothetical protein n=1 Tax=Kitasatospora sp. NPDC056138 TaxID=3345724 RepID=UPI0035D85873